MTDELTAQVAAAFSTAGRRTVRVGVEHEVPTCAPGGAPAPVAEVRRLVEGAWYAPHVGFEPGGQVELSLPPQRSSRTAAGRHRRALSDLRARCAERDIDLLDVAVDPRPEALVPLQLTTSRYLAMERHFDTIGPAGRRMMRRTASTQVCLDWWPAAAGLEQWRVLHLAGPALAAALARTTGPGSRLATWLEVDPSRTAFDGRLVSGDDPVAAYADFAAGATAFLPNADAATHLSTLFPPVRPRGRYLEVRYLDAQPLSQVSVVVDALAGMIYDDEARHRTLARLGGTEESLAESWRRAAIGDIELVAAGTDLLTELLGRTALDGAA